MKALLIATYIAAIAGANLIIGHYGPSASLWTAFTLIGLTLVVRDRLHDFWHGRQLTLRMAGLILAGGVASILTQQNVPPRLVLASVLAFGVAESFDAIVYQLAHRRHWLVRSNVSNIVSALLDSLVFVLIAFGGPWDLIFKQWAVKVLGGILWTLVLARVRTRRAMIPVAA